MAEAQETGRWRQRRRTRKDLLQAAAGLLKSGRKPSLEEVADAALVSRATAYRYFPSIEALLIEAALDVATPEPQALFAGAEAENPVARVQRVDDALHRMVVENEVPLRLMLANALERRARGDTDAPVRQNRRIPLLEAALAPVRAEFTPEAFDTLTAALAMIVGTEAMVVFTDVLQLDDAAAREVTRWAIRVLVEGARGQGE